MAWFETNATDPYPDTSGGSGAPTSATENPNTQDAWWNVWGKLKTIITQLDDSVTKLEASRDYAMSNPTLSNEYASKMAEVKSMRDKAVWLKTNIADAMSFFGVSLSGLRIDQTLRGLGVAPLLLWPIVAAGVAWLGSKALDLYNFSQKVDEQRRLEETGMTPQEAAKVVAQTAGAGTIASALGNIGTLAIIAAVGFGVWYFWSKRRG